MEGHYFDLETFSQNDKPDPDVDKIISIQFQKIDLKTGEPLGRLQILKEWEEGEESMIKFLHKWFFERNIWQFVPVGFNLNFEWKFLSAKFKKYGLDDRNIKDFCENLPQIDLKVFAVLKKGSFIGASLSSISEKQDDGNVIADFYEKKQYNEIIEYIEDEAKSFLNLYSKIVKNIDEIV